MSDTRSAQAEGYGGAKLMVNRVGAGRPVLLLHGLFSSAEVNWIKFGHAARLAEAGFEAIMPDLRAHGASESPHDPAAYPEDVLVKDALILANGLPPGGFDLVGFSLGARTAVRAVLAGLVPRRLVLGGMGLDGLTGSARRIAFFVDAIDRFDVIARGDPAYFVQAFMKTQKIDRVAARLLLGSVDDIAASALESITMPTLVICGEDDQDNGSGKALADALPDGRFVEVPGTHMSSVTRHEFGEEIVSFLLA